MMNTNSSTLAMVAALALSLLYCSGCGTQPEQQTVERVRSEVAAVLNADAAQIDITQPLVAQGADELDIVEIVMAIEDAFGITIPDRAIGETIDEVSQTLTVQKLAEIVSRQQQAK